MPVGIPIRLHLASLAFQKRLRERSNKQGYVYILGLIRRNYNFLSIRFIRNSVPERVLWRLHPGILDLFPSTVDGNWWRGSSTILCQGVGMDGRYAYCAGHTLVRSSSQEMRTDYVLVGRRIIRMYDNRRLAVTNHCKTNHISDTYLFMFTFIWA